MPVKRVAGILLATKLALCRQLRDSFLYSYEINIGGEGNTSLCYHMFGNLNHKVCSICLLSCRTYAEYIRTQATMKVTSNHNMKENFTCDSNYTESCHLQHSELINRTKKSSQWSQDIYRNIWSLLHLSWVLSVTYEYNLLPKFLVARERDISTRQLGQVAVSSRIRASARRWVKQPAHMRCPFEHWQRITHCNAYLCCCHSKGTAQAYYIDRYCLNVTWILMKKS